jgi:hypothetical protein
VTQLEAGNSPKVQAVRTAAGPAAAGRPSGGGGGVDGSGKQHATCGVGVGDVDDETKLANFARAKQCVVRSARMSCTGNNRLP